MSRMLIASVVLLAASFTGCASSRPQYVRPQPMSLAQRLDDIDQVLSMIDDPEVRKYQRFATIALNVAAVLTESQHH